jgi:stress response protein SCP2
LKQIPNKVKYLFFAVKIYTSGLTFENVKNPFVRMLDKGETQISHYKIQTVAQNATALVFCKIYRMGKKVRRWKIFK